MARIRSTNNLYVAIVLIIVGLTLIGGVAYFGIQYSLAGNDASEFTVQAPTYDIHKSNSLYPALNNNPKFWALPHESDNQPYELAGIPEGFRLIGDLPEVPAPPSNIGGVSGVPTNDMDTNSPTAPTLNPTLLPARDSSFAQSLRIPAIGLEATVEPLALVELDDATAYETPDNVVGFIPETSTPGENGTGWYFGHLESFGRNEGQVFRNLPKVAGMIKNDPVDMFIATPVGEYLYRVTYTEQISAKELALEEKDPNTIVLVTCWPPKIYSERILVTAELLAFKPSFSS